MGIEKLSHIPSDIPGFWESVRETLEAKGKKTPRIVIHGGYGKRNMGDDALLHAIYTRVQRHFPNSLITVTCHGPENIQQWYPDIVACHFKSKQSVKAILSSDLYIIGGGGIVNKINTYSGNMSFKIFDMKGKFLFLAALAAKMTGAISVFYGIGATSFPDPVVKYLTRLSLNHADYISVRDSMSMENLKQSGVKKEMNLVLDPALSLEPDDGHDAEAILQKLGFKKKPARSRPLIGFNLRYVGDPQINNSNSLAEAASLVKSLVHEFNFDVLFLSISQHPDKHLEDDLDFGLQVHKKLAEDETISNHFMVLTEYPHPRNFMALLGEMDMMILSRLHSVILGTKLGIPIVTVSYDNKVTQFVKLVGLSKWMVTLNEFTAAKVTNLLRALIKKH